MKVYIYIKCVRDNHTSLDHTLGISLTVWVKFGLVDIRIMSLIDEEFRECWCKEIHTLLKGIKEIFSLPATFLSDFGKIRYFVYTQRCVE